jgi:hypothetical protein
LHSLPVAHSQITNRKCTYSLLGFYGIPSLLVKSADGRVD